MGNQAASAVFDDTICEGDIGIVNQLNQSLKMWNGLYGILMMQC
jgi:hypothetical protein